MTCTCGHVEDEHDHECQIDGCDCICFDPEEDEEE